MCVCLTAGPSWISAAGVRCLRPQEVGLRTLSGKLAEKLTGG